MPSFSSARIIFNPKSTGTAQQAARELQAQLAERLPELPVKLLPTKRAGHATELAYQIASSAPAGTSPLIISASGDGGYNEVVNGALQAQAEGAAPICAVLPAGNANDHARTMQDRPLIDLIVDDVVTQLDVLKLDTTSHDGDHVVRYAHSYIGLGLTPTVAIQLNKHNFKSLLEAWVFIKTFWRLKPVSIQVDSKIVQLDSLICSTIPEMAKVMTLSRDSRPDDGRFELHMFKHNRKTKLVYKIIKSAVASLDAKQKVHDYSFTMVRDTPIQLDGEVLRLRRGTKVTVTACHQLLRSVAEA